MTVGEPPTDVVSAGFVAAPVLVDEQLMRVSQLVAAWLLGFGSVHTRLCYAGDVVRWREFCAEHAIEPLEARRPHVDAWARKLQESGMKPSTVG